MTYSISHRTALLLSALLSLSSAALLTCFDDGRLLHPDIAQAISGARNLLAGNGYSTSLIYYEEHYLQRTWPAPQTVFPMGFSVLIAGLAAVGIPFRTASQTLSTTGFCAMPVLICLAAMRMKRSPLISFCLAAVWLCFPMNWHNVVEQQTEMLFMSATLGSLMLLQSESLPRQRSFPAAGFLAAIAFSLRYAGIFWIISAVILIAVRDLRNPAKAVVSLLRFGLCPVLLISSLFLRNALLVGDPRGGAKTLVQKSLQSALENVYYAASRLTGLDQNDFVTGRFAEGLAAAGLVLLLIITLAVVIRKGWHFTETICQSVPVMDLAPLVYTIVSLTALTWLEKSTNINLSPRMLLPLIPFGLLAGSQMLNALLVNSSTVPRFQHVIRVSGGLIVAGLILASPDSLADVRSQIPRLGLVSDAIHRPLVQSDFVAADLLPAGMTEADVTPAMVLENTRILTSEPHMLPELLGQGAIGLCSAAYTSRIWTEDEVLALVRQYDVQLIVVLSGIPGLERNPFFDLLTADRGNEATPSWLVPVLGTRELTVFRVQDATDRVSMQPAPSSESH